MQQSPPEKKPISQAPWNIYKEFLDESSSIDANSLEKVLKGFEASIDSGLMEDPILGEGKIFSTQIAIRIVVNLLTKIHSVLPDSRQDAPYSDDKKRWSISWQVDFKFDDPPRIREVDSNKVDEESLCFDKKGQNNIIIHLLTDRKQVKRLNNGFTLGGSVQMIGRLMDRDCDFDRELEVLMTYFETVEKFEDRSDECYGFITDVSNWTFFKYCYKKDLVLRSELLSVDIDEILANETKSLSGERVIKILLSIVLRFLHSP